MQAKCRYCGKEGEANMALSDGGFLRSKEGEFQRRGFTGEHHNWICMECDRNRCPKCDCVRSQEMTREEWEAMFHATQIDLEYYSAYTKESFQQCASCFYGRPNKKIYTRTKANRQQG